MSEFSFLFHPVLLAQLSVQDIYSNICTVIYSNVHDDIIVYVQHFE